MINNAASRPLFSNVGSLPNVFDGIRDWVSPMQFQQITKTMQINGEVKETSVPVNFTGMIQPLEPRELRLKPEGQRAWSWYLLYADISLILQVDDIVTWNGKQTRVMKRENWPQQGFVLYHLVQDWNVQVSP